MLHIVYFQLVLSADVRIRIMVKSGSFLGKWTPVVFPSYRGFGYYFSNFSTLELWNPDVYTFSYTIKIKYYELIQDSE